MTFFTIARNIDDIVTASASQDPLSIILPIVWEKLQPFIVEFASVCKLTGKTIDELTKKIQTLSNVFKKPEEIDHVLQCRTLYVCNALINLNETMGINSIDNEDVQTTSEVA